MRPNSHTLLAVSTDSFQTVANDTQRGRGSDGEGDDVDGDAELRVEVGVYTIGNLPIVMEGEIADDHLTGDNTSCDSRSTTAEEDQLVCNSRPVDFGKPIFTISVQVLICVNLSYALLLIFSNLAVIFSIEMG
ncbi:hypothetical protein L1049_027707 [Liquidambar formosana]|uniref:Uncharacterized protein n=1 Tax=Liquidambar formosana TaxID=63359 RepID=A0AAP0RJ44_LIQFO